MLEKLFSVGDKVFFYNIKYDPDNINYNIPDNPVPIEGKVVRFTNRKSNHCDIREYIISKNGDPATKLSVYGFYVFSTAEEATMWSQKKYSERLRVLYDEIYKLKKEVNSIIINLDIINRLKAS